MRWIFLSSHFDDVVLSCGGLVWELVQSGRQVEICTLCAGDAPSGALSDFAKKLHAEWGTGADAVSIRRREDTAACQAVGAAYHHLSNPDAIYRSLPDGTPLVKEEKDIFQELPSPELTLAKKLSQELLELYPQRSVWVSPLSMGGHVDHRLCRATAGFLGVPLWYYADFPYINRYNIPLRPWIRGAANRFHQQVSPAGLTAWQNGIACYGSQISSFWPNLEAMRNEMTEYWQRGVGSRLWRL
ncbi:MAG TPA: PIG-L family deacetylase [Longilinea sp.]|nr:PIG-L family deacetylase [Longilinea sp.]